MNHTKQPQVKHKAIPHAIRKHLLTLATEISSKNYWVSGSSLYYPRQRTRGLTKGLRWLDYCHRRSWCLWWSELSRTWCRAECGRPWLLQKLVLLVLMEASQATLVMLLASLNRPLQLLLELLVASLPCGLNVSHNIGNKQKYTTLDLVRQSQKLDAVVDKKMCYDWDLASIFSKVIGYKLSNGYIQYLYTCCRMSFAAYTVQTQTPQSVYLGLLIINSLDEKLQRLEWVRKFWLRL